MPKNENEHIPKMIRVVFPEEQTKDMWIAHANSILVQTAVDEFIVTIGVTPPPAYPDVPIALCSSEPSENLIVPAEPLFRFAVSRFAMAKFIETMDFHYHRQIELEKREEKEAAKREKEEKQ